MDTAALSPSPARSSGTCEPRTAPRPPSTPTWSASPRPRRSCAPAARGWWMPPGLTWLCAFSTAGSKRKRRSLPAPWRACGLRSSPTNRSRSSPRTRCAGYSRTASARTSSPAATQASSCCCSTPAFAAPRLPASSSTTWTRTTRSCACSMRAASSARCRPGNERCKPLTATHGPSSPQGRDSSLALAWAQGTAHRVGDRHHVAAARQGGRRPQPPPHQFRHTFARQSLADGGGETDLMRLASWRSRTMLQRYGASAADARAREAHRLRSPVDRL